MANFPDEVIEHVFHYMNSRRDRNSVSLVCKNWYRIERLSRKSVFIGNCYSISPERVIERFPRLKSLTLKGKPHFLDSNFVPYGWGGFVYPWIDALVKSEIELEGLRLKRMVVTDKCLQLLSCSFMNFESLILDRCEGFTTEGLAAIAANCRFLKDLDLRESKVDDNRGHWLSCFPDCCTSLVSLKYACLKGSVNLTALERLVARSPNLRSLRVNGNVPLDALKRILMLAPTLVDLGTGSFVHDPYSAAFARLRNIISKCKSITELSGFFNVLPYCLSAIYPICLNLTCLNLCRASGIPSNSLVKLISRCAKLQRLWAMDWIGDKGLEAVALTCKDLQELRVYASFHIIRNDLIGVSEKGLCAISIGCPKLYSLLYTCRQMTNAALITVAKNCPNFISFRLCIIDPKKPDHTTMHPFDEGFGAIMQSCKQLKRLALSGHLTDLVFIYIGMYCEQLEILSVTFAGESSDGILYVFSGCQKLRKLDIRDSRIGNSTLLMDVERYKTMQSLWMSSCNVSFGACKILAKKMPSLNVEIINENQRPNYIADDEDRVKKMYSYRTLAGKRKDAPEYVMTL